MNIRFKYWDNGANLNEFGQNKRIGILGVWSRLEETYTSTNLPVQKRRQR